MSALADALRAAGLPLDPPRMTDVLLASPRTHKRCGKCGAVKPLDAFYRHPSCWLGRQSQCITCMLAYDAERRKAA